MKASKLLFCLFLILITGFTSCSSDEENHIVETELPNNQLSDVISKDELPGLTKSFINKYLPDHQIIKIEDLKPEVTDLNKYKITFSDDLTIIFNNVGYWWRAESKTKLPASLIEAFDKEEIEALKTKYPNPELKAIYNDTEFRRKVTLADNTSLALYTDFTEANAVKVIVATDLTEKQETVPQKIKNFIETYYSEMNIEYIIYATESNGREIYKISLQQKTNIRTDVITKLSAKISFDKNGDWYSITNQNYPISGNLYSTFPQNIKDVMAKQYPNTPVFEAIKYDAYYQLRISNTLSVLVDTESTGYLFRMDVVQEFIKKHFDSDTFPEIKFSTSHQNPVIYNGEINIAGYYIEMEANIEGIWQMLKVENKPMPLSIFDTLPEGIKTTLESKKLLEKVKKITKETNRGYSVEADNSVFKFDRNGSLLSS
ncbi:putative PepSY-like beta-lactamase-inhibitor [Dysgonomonas alginatilytica]|uniref:Putative PepSY-like beta-lactamase-inhibitor n=1 Tax=Dysgonomonas alginatilytica TaxID=1605892 RepID=A0A2V3PTV2_9BACT|nr:PepSY-like domain-containing protein [Dysgonomonas alginatilytica]PXV69053.1 putative PepSY-like beta-lactamase-inhibitor [Dysgonomonas alginatilytica]